MGKYIVTGAAGFIASKVCEDLLNEGHSVIGMDNFDPGYDLRIKEWRLKQFSAHPNFRFYRDSICDRKKLMSIFQDNPGIDGVINLAAKAGVRDSLINPWSYYETNLTGTFICCKAVMPHMMERRRGRIINISSVAGKIGFATGSAYCASKWGVIGFSRSLAAEAKPHNIRVDVICPGTVDTPFPHSPAASKLMLEVEDVVRAVMFLLSLPERARVEDIVMHPNV